MRRHRDEVATSDDRHDRMVDVRDRFGGSDVAAILAGMLAALGSLALLGGLAAAAGSIGYQYGLDEASDESLGIGGFVAGLVVLVLSFLIGGWVAGRMARYDGGRNGLLTALSFVALAAALAGLGAWVGSEYDVLDEFELPQWFRDGDYTTEAIISAAAAIALSLLAGWLGGKLGERYHRRADDAIVATHRDHLASDDVRGPATATTSTTAAGDDTAVLRR